MSDNLTIPLNVQVSIPRFGDHPNGESLSAVRLVRVDAIEQEQNGASLRFQGMLQGTLDRSDPEYAARLRLAQRATERLHPIGVRFGERQTIQEILRADNDVPAQVWENERDSVRVLFQGHNAIYHLKPGHSEAVRIRNVLDEAVLRSARVWFIARKPDLALLDMMPLNSANSPNDVSRMPDTALRNVTISFVVAPDHVVKAADDILRSRISCTNAIRREIRALAKAYIDEADELKRALQEIQTMAPRIQIESLSPPEMIDRAKRLHGLQLASKSVQEKIRLVADSYVRIAETNKRLFDEFRAKYQGTTAIVQ